jgi:hypothetical protein
MTLALLKFSCGFTACTITRIVPYTLYAIFLCNIISGHTRLLFDT